MMKSISKIIRWFVVALLSLLLSWAMYTVFYNTNIKHEQQRFQNEFSALEKKQKSFINGLNEVVKNRTTEAIWKLHDLQNSEFSVHLFTNDSLIYWNSNLIDFHTAISDTNQHFVGKFPNGYYLVDQFKIFDLTAFVSSKIKSEYFYQNNVLQNKITDYFSTTNVLQIDFEKSDDNFPIVSTNGKDLFYITVLGKKTVGKYQQLLIFGFYAFAFLCLLISITHFIRFLTRKKRWFVVLYPLVLFSSYFLIKHIENQTFSSFEICSPNLYVNSIFIPNLGNLILNLISVFIAIWWILYFLNRVDEKKKSSSPILIVGYFGLLLYSAFISYTFESLIISSSISLNIDEIFSLSIYSFIALLIIAFLFFSFYVLIRQLSIKLVHSTIPLNILALIWFFTGVLFFIFELFYFHHDVFPALWPVLLNALFFYLASKKHRLNELKYHIIIVIVIGFYGAVILFENNRSNEHLKRELYANQLITDQDPTMEIEYAETIKSLINNPDFYQLIENVNYFSAPNFSLNIENCCFDEFWERYEMNFFFFNSDGTPLLEYVNDQSKTEEDFFHIIKNHSSPSSIAEELYFVTDYYEQLSYIGYNKITTSKGKKLDFFILFKSKKIPEKIGFPRLLMNEKSYALNDLEDYSIARYSKGNLVMRFGAFNYPTTLNGFGGKLEGKSGFITINGINHLIYRQNDGQSVVISKPEKQFIEQLSTFSYLVIFFGIFALIVLAIFNSSKILSVKTLQLSLKVQVVLIGMMVGTFIIFAGIAIENVTRQYNINTQDSLKEKIYSVESVLGQRLKDKETLTPSVHADYMTYMLKRLSNVFATDINFYTVDGKLFSTSQAKIYDKGISSHSMNSRAFLAMSYDLKSEFVHREKYGNLSFLSGYVPFTNHNGKLLGYINLQHFSKQDIFEKQLNGFIVAVINIAVLLLVVSVILAIIVSGWITSPLKLIQQSFSKVELGKVNKPIPYKANDEIGALVKEYNNKLAELELKAMELAQSERETAWREMAKQIAHEIKNPLTPMKLSVQHFQRSFDPNDPNIKDKIQRIVHSLIEQIDALTNIANEFSNFAKMPKANEENLNLIPLLNNIIGLYSSHNVHIKLVQNQHQEVWIFADKDLILRVFNNLIKNAIQATEETENAQIKIKIEKEQSNYIISIQDNGTGISEELKDKMFVPNFTTKSTGSGLGLAMVKQIITTHNGSIWFKSEKNKGVTFYIRLPELKR